MRKIFYLLFISVITFVGCSKDKDGDTPTVTDQGRIELSMSFTNATVNKFFQLMKASNKVGPEAIIEARLGLTAEELEFLDELGMESWFLLEDFFMKPFVKNEIFFKADEFRMVSTSITYTVEKKWNNTTSEGNYFITNRRDDDISFDYDLELLGGLITNLPLKTGYYDRNEESIITTLNGLPAKKITYTLKEGMSEGLKAIHVHTSTAIDKMYNAFHPVYTQEENGIIRIELEYSNNTLGSMIYEVAKVENRAVSDDELTNSTSAHIIDSKEDGARNEISEKIHQIISLPR
ncbi:hypothetical protein [Gynurincola endophyticus]|uniref:hypothetical protein n=1 Tax=Gynurincola endophyticus TaxID=2479004 RepID=UPI000F8E834E|nr:hypothetical protein [Gynurincola endophyticus]